MMLFYRNLIYIYSYTTTTNNNNIIKQLIYSYLAMEYSWNKGLITPHNTLYCIPCIIINKTLRKGDHYVTLPHIHPRILDII